MKAAIQTIADLVTANSAEDEKTAAALNKRIDRLELRLA